MSFAQALIFVLPRWIIELYQVFLKSQLLYIFYVRLIVWHIWFHLIAYICCRQCYLDESYSSIMSFIKLIIISRNLDKCLIVHLIWFYVFGWSYFDIFHTFDESYCCITSSLKVQVWNWIYQRRAFVWWTCCETNNDKKVFKKDEKRWN